MTKKDKSIPNGFPITKPNPIPIECRPLNPERNSGLKGIAVLASVNNGSIINITGRCKRYCNFIEGVSLVPFLKGQANANRTPEIVG